jgi:polysaccharide export outer membrane protein
MVVSVRWSACVAAIALVLTGHAMAQTTPRAAAAQAPQAPDLRIGAVRPADSSDPVTDGGQRNAAAPAGPQAVYGLGKDYKFGPNDLLEVEVLDVENLKRTVRVNAAGAISLPLIGAVVVGGLTSAEAEQRIAERYAEKYLQNPQGSIFIKEFTTERITVEGAVARPGIFPLTGQMTLLRVLAVAGGFGPIANTHEVMLYRVNDQKQREVAIYDVEKIRAGKADDPPIRGDDLIVVQRDGTRAILKDSVLRDIVDTVNPFSIFSR